MIVVSTDEARDDLEGIGDYIAADNPARALSFVLEISERCEDLSDMADAFPLVPRYEHTKVRRRPFRNYVIFYRVIADRVDMLHILNSAQDCEAVLFGDAD
ncbi:plasmid stabilization protein [Devosia riboflavina]|uniref:Plasmid stabilization protein n=1 Tax=Devosia riboflavina TaxID=46914 RepID=A0A087LZJ7_9HYPH|nr:type II toxin-antitoxin system RelE/ParE family toxin [Devosia riboflavina]KFL30050.1 plasmid stabilization protein [Devosia riboflavina]